MHVNVKLSKMVPSLKDKNNEIPILQGFCETKRYMTLFDIGTGGGCPDQDKRRKWERRLFGPVYDGFDSQRPRYGNLNLMAHLKGDKAATYYGKSYFVLKKHVRKRCTMTSCDSHRPEAELGTLSHCAHVLCHVVDMCDLAKRPLLIKKIHRLATYDGKKSLPTTDTEL